MQMKWVIEDLEKRALVVRAHVHIISEEIILCSATKNSRIKTENNF